MRRLLVALSVLSLGLAGCSAATEGSNESGESATPTAASEPEERVATPDEAILGTTGDYATLDFQARGTPTVLTYSWPGYDRLLAYNSDKTEFVPYLATEWSAEPEDSPTRYTFTIRDDAVCPDGSPITPSAIEASMQRFLDVEKEANRIPQLFGSGPFTMSADDENNEFVWETESPYVNTLHGLAKTGIICPEGLAAVEDDPEALLSAQYGSGPYELGEAVSGSHVTWRKRDDWSWGPPGTDLANLPETLTYQVVSDATTLANLVTTGGVDFAPVAGPDVERLLNDPNLQSVDTYNRAPMVLEFNQHEGRVFSDPVLREAVFLAVDPEAVLAAAGGRGQIVPSVVHPETPCFNTNLDSLVPETDPEAARQLLLDAGYEDPVTIDLLATTDLGGVGEYLATVLGEVGFDVKLSNLPFGELAQRFVAEDFDLVTGQSINYDFQQAYNIQLFSGSPPPDGSNFGNIGAGSEEWDRLAVEAVSTTDCQPLEEWQELALTEQFLYPIYFADVYGFGGQEWDFPEVLYEMEYLWLKPQGA